MPRRTSKRKRTGRRRRAWLEKLEPRRLMAADSIGVTPNDTAEFLLGSVAVTPIFLESNEQSATNDENWDAQEIDSVLEKIAEGVNWWSRTLAELNTRHTLEFVIDDSFAHDPVEIPWEPIRSSSNYRGWARDFLAEQGYDNSLTSDAGMKVFNHQQRERLGTDWAFSIFVADASEDGDGLFDAGPFAGAFALAGGYYLVTPSTRPASTIAHEMGHIFWARDEYPLPSNPDSPNYQKRRGYYDAPNLNAADNDTPGFVQEASIMRGGIPLNTAYQGLFSPESTLAQVGWHNSDGDGIFDLADVPLDLQVTGYLDEASSSFHLEGSASAVPSFNRNSSGAQSDITLNRITALQYRHNGGEWVTAAEYDNQVVEIDLEISIPDLEPNSYLEWRVLDESIGVTSATVASDLKRPTLSPASIVGHVFLDENGNGQREIGETRLVGTQIQVSDANGAALFGGRVDSDDQPDGVIDEAVGVQLSAMGTFLDGEVAAYASLSDGETRRFHAYNWRKRDWLDGWSSDSKLVASFDQPVGQVTIDAMALGAPSYARLEAYDAAGELIQRHTTKLIATGSNESITVSDPQGRIASIHAFGHAETTIALDDLQFGFNDTVIVDVSGGFRIENLPDGVYQLQMTAANLIHQFDSEFISVQVQNGTSQFVDVGGFRGDSPRTNVAFAEDVSRDGVVTSRDALLVINDLIRLQPRLLGPDEVVGDAIDVNNDGSVSAIDALRVINFLTKSLGGESESISIDPVATATGGTDELISGLANSPTATTFADGTAAGEAQRDETNTVIVAAGLDADSVSVADFGPADPEGEWALDPRQVDQLHRLGPEVIDAELFAESLPIADLQLVLDPTPGESTSGESEKVEETPHSPNSLLARSAHTTSSLQPKSPNLLEPFAGPEI